MVIIQHNKERHPREQSKSKKVDNVSTEQKAAKPESFSNPVKL